MTEPKEYPESGNTSPVAPQRTSSQTTQNGEINVEIPSSNLRGLWDMFMDARRDLAPISRPERSPEREEEEDLQRQLEGDEFPPALPSFLPRIFNASSPTSPVVPVPCTRAELNTLVTSTVTEQFEAERHNIREETRASILQHLEVLISDKIQAHISDVVSMTRQLSGTDDGNKLAVDHTVTLLKGMSGQTRRALLTDPDVLKILKVVVDRLEMEISDKEWESAL